MPLGFVVLKSSFFFMVFVSVPFPPFWFIHTYFCLSLFFSLLLFLVLGRFATSSPSAWCSFAWSLRPTFAFSSVWLRSKTKLIRKLINIINNLSVKKIKRKNKIIIEIFLFREKNFQFKIYFWKFFFLKNHEIVKS